MSILWFGPLLQFLYTSELFSIQQNKLISYADDYTLMAVVPFPGVSVPSPGFRVTVAESMIFVLGRVCEWCDLWGMMLNVSIFTLFQEQLLKDLIS